MEGLRKVLRSHSDNFLHRMKAYSIYKNESIAPRCLQIERCSDG